MIPKTAAQQAAFRLACQLPVRTVAGRPRLSAPGATARYDLALQKRIRALRARGLSYERIAKLVGCSRPTVYRHLMAYR